MEMDVWPCPDRFQQLEGAEDVRFDELAWAVDAPIDVAFGREVHDGVHAVVVEELADEPCVADVPFAERIPALVDAGCQILRIAGVREQVEVDDSSVKGRVAEEHADEGRSDES